MTGPVAGTERIASLDTFERASRGWTKKTDRRSIHRALEEQQAENIVFTTPYVLAEPGETEWLAYFARALPAGLSERREAAYEKHVKRRGSLLASFASDPAVSSSTLPALVLRRARA